MPMNKKNMTIAAGVALALVAGVLAYKSLTMQGPVDPAAEGPVIVGGLVGIDPAAIVVKAADGTEMKFFASSKTPVMSPVKEGETGKAFEQLSVGDVLAITADGNGAVARKIEIVPAGQAAPGAQALVLRGTLVNAAGRSFVVRPFAPNEALASTVSDITVEVREGTEVRTLVLGGQTGKALQEVVPGAQVSVWGSVSEEGIEADSVLFSPAR